jgi:hypothetical protein
MQDLAAPASEVLAFAQLCVFGLQYQQGLDAVGRYLEMPNAADRESALLLKEKALIGLKDLPDAAAGLFSLEREFTYDAPINSIVDQLISTGTLASDEFNAVALVLCEDQIRNTLPLVEAGNALTGKDATFPPVALFADAVRCFEIQRALHGASSQTTVAQLQSVLQLPIWNRKAELATIEAALERAQMVGMAAPLSKISGQLIGSSGTLSLDSIGIRKGNDLFIAFTLWSPSALTIAQDLHLTFPQQSIYLLTSWTANTGGADEPSSMILQSLRAAAQSLPARAHILIVPDSVLELFHVDAFPVAIVVRDGVVAADIPLVGDAGERLPVLAMGGSPAAQNLHRAGK